MKPFFKILFICLAFVASSALAEPKPNVDGSGVGIHGYDPVAFFTDGKPVPGNEKFRIRFHDVTYRFASAQHEAMFEKDSAKYEPQFGGYCAYGVSKGHLTPVKIDAFQIVNGRLLMQYNTEVRDTFNKDQKGNLNTADKTWPTLAGKGQ